VKTIRDKELETETIVSENVDGRGADSGLSFEVSPDVIEENQRFVIKGYLINPLSEPKEIVVFPVGKMGFRVNFASTDLMTYVGPLFPPSAPSPPVKIVVPAETRVKFTALIIKETEKPLDDPGMPQPSPMSSPDILSLEDYDYSGSPTVELNWSFCYWSGDRPSGILSVTLPKR